MYDENGQANVPHREWLLDFDRVLKEVKEELKAQGREDEFVGARVRRTKKNLRANSMLTSTLDHLYHSPRCI